MPLARSRSAGSFAPLRIRGHSLFPSRVECPGRHRAIGTCRLRGPRLAGPRIDRRPVRDHRTMAAQQLPWQVLARCGDAART